MKPHSAILMLLLCPMFNSCERSATPTMNINLKELNNVSQEKWNALKGKKIFFGHQSVGLNIIDGIKDIASEFPMSNLVIKETSDARDFGKAVFAHAAVGKNADPLSKCDDFKRIIENGVGTSADVAFFKFCYVDITRNTDIESVFKRYVEAMDQLQAKYPKVTFIHCTVPLKVTPSGLKTKIKRLAGLSVSADEDNVLRNEFNDRLREKYRQTNVLFDLAHYESLYQDGSKSTFEKKGKQYYSLIPGYSDDGGHLNARGRKAIGKELISFLAVL